MEAPTVVFKKRVPKGVVRKAAPPPPDSESSGSDIEDNEGRLVKRRKTTGKLVTASSANQKPQSHFEGTTKYNADRSNILEASNDATKHSNWYDEDAKDSLTSKNLLGTTRTKTETFIKKNPDAPTKPMGPMKAPSNVRTITVTDYAPDVCKDYKQTGFCGFGDNCKFLHAREDYAAGWKLDREWEMSGKSKQGGTVFSSADRKGEEKDEDGFDYALLDKIPFACVICKKDYKSPIITKCQHYFCEACALKRYRKDPSCAACGAPTGGVFNGAKNLQKLLDRKKKYEEKKKAESKVDEEGDEGKDLPKGK
jgi:RING finger protein 113A